MKRSRFFAAAALVFAALGSFAIATPASAAQNDHHRHHHHKHHGHHMHHVDHG